MVPMQLELKNPKAQSKPVPPMTGDSAQKIDLQVLGHAEPLEAATASGLHQDQSLNSSSLDPDKKIAVLFRAYANEDFEDGADSEFVSEMAASIRTYGTQAVEAIRCVVLTQNPKADISFAALRWLGRINHLESHRARLAFLETCLGSPSRLVRDGAALGLASMKDAHAISFLREAIAREEIQDLREDMESVLLRLEISSNAEIFVDDK